MKNYLPSLRTLALLICLSTAYQATTYAQTTIEWTWMKGDTTPIHAGVYGTQGTPDPANIPGSRGLFCTWNDGKGNLYLFGGVGYGTSTASAGRLNDLWKYSIASKEWTFLKGSTSTNQLGTYGTMGMPDANNVPSGRQGASSWMGNDGNLYLYGGYGYGSTTATGQLSDMWRYNPATNEWTWLNGDKVLTAQPPVYGTQGVPDAANKRGQCYGGAAWTDKDGNLWSYGGQGMLTRSTGGQQTAESGELWKYNPKTNEWAWMKGDPIFQGQMVKGTIGVPDTANKPGPLIFPLYAQDMNGTSFYLYGGENFSGTGNSLQVCSNLWRYDVATNMWTCVKETPNYNAVPVYGTLGTPDMANTPGGRLLGPAWVDDQGDFWIYGGQTYKLVFFPNKNVGAAGADLWRYGISTGNWTWMSGDSVSGTNTSFKAGVYGTQGVAAPGNNPGTRAYNEATWNTGHNEFWMFGGTSDVGSKYNNDLWKLKITLPPPACTPTTSTLTKAACTSFDFNHHTYTASGTYTDTLKNANSAGCDSIVTLKLTINAYPTGTITATACGNYSYNHKTYTSSGTYTDTVPYKHLEDLCDSIVTLKLTINKLPDVTATSIPDPAVICAGDEVTLNYKAGLTGDKMSYTWDKGVTGNKAFKPTQTETYTVTANDLTTGCKNTDDITVTVNPLPKVTATAQPEKVCTGEKTTITQGGNAVSYSWDKKVTSGVPFAPSVTQTYTVTGTDANGCTNKASVTVTVNPLPNVTANAKPGKEICEGNEVTLTGGGAASYNWNNNVTDGKAFVPAQTETYTVTGTDANGCKDSADITITVKDTTIVAVADTICSGDVYTFGTQTLRRPGTYTETFVAANGCDSTVNLDLTVNTVDLSITQKGNELSAIAGATAYQWINCKDNSPIPNATQQSYSSDVTGDFAVIVTVGDCTDTSTCYHIEGRTGINETSLQREITLYPNPAHSRITVQSNEQLQNATISVVNIIGQVVMEKAQINGSNFVLDVQKYAAGIYYLEVMENQRFSRIKFVKD